MSVLRTEVLCRRSWLPKKVGFFNTEMGKLDRWAEDVKNSLEIELKELDRNNGTVYYQVESYMAVS